MADSRLRLSLDVTAVPGPGRSGPASTRCSLAGALAARPDVDLVLFGRRSDATRWDGPAPGPGWTPMAPGPRPLRLAWEQLRLPGPAGPAGVIRPPRAALHHAGALVGAGRGHRPRPELLRGPPVAPAVQGPAVPPGHQGGRPPGRGRGLPEPGDRRGAGPLVPGGRRGVRGPPRRRHPAVPARGAHPGSERTTPRWPPWTAAWPTAVPSSSSSGPSSPARTSPPWSAPSPAWPTGTPTRCWCWPGAAGGGPRPWSGPSGPVRGGRPDRADRLRARRGGPGPAALGDRRRLPGPLRGVRPPALEALACGAPAGHHHGDGHGGGGRRRPPCWSPRAMRTGWPTPWMPRWRAGATAAGPSGDRRRGGSTSWPATPGRPAPSGTCEAYRHAAGR